LAAFCVVLALELEAVLDSSLLVEPQAARTSIAATSARALAASLARRETECDMEPLLRG
jgi:hypothetical protein